MMEAAGKAGRSNGVFMGMSPLGSLMRPLGCRS
jgi:hypothetical protein